MEVLHLDSAGVTNTFSFEEGRPTLIFLFSPDCDHCGTDADTLLRFMREKPNLRVVAVSFAPLAQIRAFAKEHHFEGTPNLTFGKDPYTFVPRFYGVQYFPFFALYNKDKKLVQTWDGGVKWDALRNLLR
jgi:thiol-disulfide isomerase/thioredoxin